jgi:uncharacterized membrane protein
MTFLLALVLIGIGVVIRLSKRVSQIQDELDEVRSMLRALEQRIVPPVAATTQPAEAEVAPASADHRPVAIPIAESSPASQQTVPEPPPAAAPAVVPPRSTTQPAISLESLESRIGGRWLLYIGMATILVGASYFVKLAFDNEWITPAMQILFGSAIGMLLIGSGPIFRKRGYALYGQILAGGGIALLYLCIYAAFNFYALIGPTLAFGLMIAVTAVGAVLADREQSQGLALMAVGGGFFTPFLVSTGRDAQIALFGYDAVLVAGTMVLARRRNWAALNALSFFLTLLTLGAWAGRFYRPEKWLTTYAFLTLFAAMFIYIRHESRRWGTALARHVSRLLVLAPVLYHLFSLAILSDHGTWFLAYLVVATAAGLSVNARRETAGLRIVLWVAIMLPLLAWTIGHSAWPAIATCGVAGAVYVMHLTAQAMVAQRDGELRDMDVALLYLITFGLYVAFEASLEPRWIASLPVVALAIGLWNGVLAAALRRRWPMMWLHFVVLAAGFGAIAVARQFDGPAKPVGWAVLAAGLLWLGLLHSRYWIRACGGVLLAIALTELVRLLFLPAPAWQLPAINPRALATLFVIALLGLLARMHRRSADTVAVGTRAVVIVTANLLALALITSEIQAFWTGRSGYLTRHMMMSLAWALYAVGLIVYGIRRRYAPVRYLAMVVFGVTTLKLFLLDLAALDQAYRVLSAVGLGVLLLIASFLYQRYREELSGEERA